MKRKWTNESANSYAIKVETGKQKYGLTYLSAVDFLGRKVDFVAVQKSLGLIPKEAHI